MYILTTVDKPLSRYLQFMFDFSCETDSALEEDFQQKIQALEEVSSPSVCLYALSKFSWEYLTHMDERQQLTFIVRQQKIDGRNFVSCASIPRHYLTIRLN